MTNGTFQYGDAEPKVVQSALANFGPQIVIREISFCCTPIELLSNDGNKSVISHATGFFYRYNNRSYLVTNWHVVSGRNALTGKLNENGFIPTHIAFYGFDVRAMDNGQVEFSRPRVCIDFDEGMKTRLAVPQVLEGRTTDIVSFPIADHFVIHQDSSRQIFTNSDTISSFINDHASLEIQTAVGDDCFVVGYPLRNFSGTKFPVWKRGSIASEPLVGLGEYGAFLIDSATTEGMSGSPILRFSRGPNTLQGGAEVTQLTGFKFVGVYGGHLESADLAKTNLGYGWYKADIDRVIDSWAFGDLKILI